MKTLEELYVDLAACETRIHALQVAQRYGADSLGGSKTRNELRKARQMQAGLWLAIATVRSAQKGVRP